MRKGRSGKRKQPKTNTAKLILTAIDILKETRSALHELEFQLDEVGDLLLAQQAYEEMR